MSITILGRSHIDEDYDLDPIGLEALWRMEDRHFWHAARNRWIELSLRANGVQPPARVLEVGCGGGAVLRHLDHCAYTVTGIDTADVLVRKAHERCARAELFVGQLEQLPITVPFDAIGVFDVLEHLTQPQHLLEAARPHCRPGTVLVATVPALAALHTVIDDISGHKRRYEVGELGRLLSNAGFTDVVEHGIFRATMMAQHVARRKFPSSEASALSLEARRAIMVDNARVPSTPVNRALGWVCAIESRFFRASVARAGASLLATARA